MTKKEYKNGTKEYVIGTDGYKRNRKIVQKHNANYKSKTYKRVTLLIRKDDDDVLNKLENVPSKNKYIIDLIKKDIEMNG